MSALLVTVMEVAQVGFVLLARKLILCGELIAIVGMVGWNLDARVGLSLWPRRTLGKSRVSPVFAAAATVLVVLYVAFIRDFGELGSNPSFMRYGGMCLGVMAVVAACGALWTRGLRADFDLVGLLSVWAIAAVGIVCIDGGVRLGSALLQPIGRWFLNGPECAHHGLATLLTSGGALALSFRLFLTRGQLRSRGPWDLFLVFALLALVQGFLAYRGVSAIYVLAVPAALAWRAGWRAQLAWGEPGFVAKLVRAPRAQVDSGHLQTAMP